LAHRFVEWIRLAGSETPALCHRQELTHRRLAIEVWRGRARHPRGVTPDPYVSLAWHPLAGLGKLGLSSATRAIVRALT
jgi:hypothetical protein